MPPERVLLVVNKVDLAPAWDLSCAAGAVHVSRGPAPAFPSCATPSCADSSPAPGPDEPVPFTPELCDAVEEAHAHLKAGRIDNARRVLRGLLDSPGGSHP